MLLLESTSGNYSRVLEGQVQLRTNSLENAATRTEGLER